MKFRSLTAGLLAGTFGMSAVIIEAAEIRYNFSGFGGSETVNGFFTLDTSAMPDTEFLSLGLVGFDGNEFSDTPLIDFGLTISSGGQDISFNAQRPISNQDPNAGVIGSVTDNQLAGVDSEGNAIFSDSFSFSIFDQGLAATPPNPVFSTITTNDIVSHLFFTRLSVSGASELIDGLTPPASIDFSEAVFAELFLQIGFAVFDPNQNRFVSVGDTSATYTLTDISPSPVPLPAAAWLFLSAIGGLFGVKRFRQTAA